MLLDTVILGLSGFFAWALVLTEPMPDRRWLAIGLFAAHVLVFWLVVLPYHRHRQSDLWLDNIEVI